MTCHARLVAAGVLLALIWILAGSGCGKPTKTPTLADEMEPDVSEAELSARLVEYAHRYIGRVEHLVGDVLRETADSEIRKRAMIWAIRVNEEVVRTTFYRDPIAVLIDLWALAAQYRDYAARRAADPAAPDEFIDRAAALTAELEADMERLAMEYGGEQVRANGRENLDLWVAEHPLTGELYRTSTAPLIAKIAPQASSDLFNTIGDMQKSINDISFRLDIMTHQLPKQFIWHAAMLTEYYLGTADIPELVAKASSALTLTEDLPATIQAEREAIFAEIDRQREETLAEIDRQRVALTADIDTQRRETVDEIAALTRESFEVVDAQGARFDAAIERTTQEITDAVEIQANAVFAEIDSVIDRSVAETEDAMALVDHIFWRLLALGGAIFIGVLVLLIINGRIIIRASA